MDVAIAPKQLDVFTVQPTKDKNHGDVATNAAMVLCKNFSMKPQDLAQKIINELQANDKIAKAQIAGPGFINITLDFAIWQDFIADIVRKNKVDVPQIAHDNSGLINLEYASPNPTGPMHIGHARGAIYGDVLASLLIKTGHKVTKEYYMNDAGSQINTLLKSAFLRYLEALGQEITITDGLYPGEYLQPVGQGLKVKFGDALQGKSEAEYAPLIRDFVLEKMMEMITADLADIGICHDVLFSEKKNLHDSGKIDAAIEVLRQQGLVYEGKIADPKGGPKGEKGDVVADGDQLLFRSTKFGDDEDRVIKKSDGTPTYFAADIAYVLNKFERGATKMILPLGYDHAGYVKRLKAACQAVTGGKAQVEVILCQMVKFIKNGQQLKMSKRAGNFITLKDVAAEIGADALRFTMLTRKNDAPFDFDLAQVVDASKDNPIFYVQYAHARCASVLRNFAEQMPGADISGIDPKILQNLQDETEIELIKKLANCGRIIEMAVQNYEPHRLAFYAQEVAALLHSLWNKGVEDANLKFIIANKPQITLARMALITATKKTIFTILDIFNIKALEEMR